MPPPPAPTTLIASTQGGWWPNGTRLTRRDPHTGILLASLLTCLLVLGLLSLILAQVLLDYDSIEDAFEWVMALLIHLYFITLSFAWRDTSFGASFAGRQKKGT